MSHEKAALRIVDFLLDQLESELACVEEWLGVDRDSVSADDVDRVRRRAYVMLWARAQGWIESDTREG